MHSLTDSDYKLYKSVISLKQKPLRKTLYSFLTRKYDKVIAKEEYLFAYGNIPIALVAHMDTVFPKPPEHIYYDREAGVIWSPEGGCGDDRAGVFAILKIIQSGLRPTIIFTADEEMGGLGAEQLVKDFPEVPIKLNYIIELDRRGTCDCVFYDCDNPAFTEYVESFGFIENYGSFSDISEICPAWGIAGVNLSIGYENEHSTSETVHVNPLLKTIARVKKMLQQETIPEFKYVPSTTAFYPWDNFIRAGYGYGWDIDGYANNYFRCSGCGHPFEDFELIPVKGIDMKQKYYCPDCCVTKVNWCAECGEAFEKKDPSEKLCPRCRETKGGKEKCNTPQFKNNLML